MILYVWVASIHFAKVVLRQDSAKRKSDVSIVGVLARPSIDIQRSNFPNHIKFSQWASLACTMKAR
jgi:hypothetical protein